jgi:hypothetical protein
MAKTRRKSEVKGKSRREEEPPAIRVEITARYVGPEETITVAEASNLITAHGHRYLLETKGLKGGQPGEGGYTFETPVYRTMTKLIEQCHGKLIPRQVGLTYVLPPVHE